MGGRFIMVVDFHCHILPASFPQRLAGLRARDATLAALFAGANPRMATAEALLGDMDRAGVDHAVVMGMGWTDPALAREVNDYLAQAVASHPRRLTGFCSVNPAWGDAAVSELERCVRAGLRGVGELHPDTQGFDLTHRDTMQPLMDAARRLGLPVVVHSSEPVGHQYPGKGQTTPDKLYQFIQHFPENTIVCAHWGGGLPFYALMPEVPQVLQNVYFDSAASPLLYRPEVFAEVARLAGAQRLLLGTDYPLVGHRRLLRQVAECGLPEAEQAAILGGNAVRLLGLTPGAE
jgi:predicted TIM-barrel fold metal-dependent hydrolase